MKTSVQSGYFFIYACLNYLRVRLNMNRFNGTLEEAAATGGGGGGGDPPVW